ncbi:MAG: N-acylneuraminate cytidylyltransferase [Myxococcales bacterium]|nr:MAG: N-acylneuraminate cytidylyltransferase [Myxococcales bacterium]
MERERLNTLALIPARGGSRGIPGKNIRVLAGKPLIHWTMEAALCAKEVSGVYLCSDSSSIRSVANEIKNPKLNVIDRRAENASDTASTESVMLEFAERFDFDILVLIQATSPLLDATDLDGALDQFKKSDFDSMLSVTREHQFLWKMVDGRGEATNYDPLNRPRRQDWDGELVENGAFYITTKKALIQSSCRLSGKIALWEMPRERSVDIDEHHDFAIAESLLSTAKKVNGDFSQRVGQLKWLISDVDGVLTDGGMFYGPEGEALKKFNTKDGKACELLRKAGLGVGILTQENSPSVAARAKKLMLDPVFLGAEDKVKVLSEFMKQKQLAPHEIAYIGDDLNDIAVMKQVGLAACPADAVSGAKAVAHYHCTTRGGQGCLREFADQILRFR